MIDELLERVYDRCVEDEHGCMNWAGAVQSACKSPVIRRGDASHSSSLRRWMLEEATGKTMPSNKVATYKCGNPRCVKLEHLVIVTRSHIQRRNSAQFDAAAKLRKSHRIIVKARANAKLSMEVVRDIRSAEGSQREIARRFGVCQTTVGAIQRGETWRDLSDPFARMAA